LLASCLDSTLRLLQTDTGELLNTYTGHAATSTRAEGRLSHDDACVLSTSEDGRVVAWDIVQSVIVRQFKVRVSQFLGCAVAFVLKLDCAKIKFTNQCDVCFLP
jgi:mitogen-activated protein kinase organizer 1